MSRPLIFLGSYRGWDLHLDVDDEFFADRGDGRRVLRSPVMADLKGMIDTCEDAQRWLRVNVIGGEYEIVAGAKPQPAPSGGGEVVLPIEHRSKVDALNAEVARAEADVPKAITRSRLARQRRRKFLTSGGLEGDEQW